MVFLFGERENVGRLTFLVVLCDACGLKEFSEWRRCRRPSNLHRRREMVQLWIIIKRANTTQRIDKLKDKVKWAQLLWSASSSSVRWNLRVGLSQWRSCFLEISHAATVFTLCALLHISPNIPSINNPYASHVPVELHSHPLVRKRASCALWM